MRTFKVGDRVEALFGVPQDPHTPFLIGGTISEVAHHINGQVAIAWVDWDNSRKTGHMNPQTQLIRIEKEPAVTDRKNHLHELDKQRTTAQEFEKYYKELRETIETKIAKIANSPELMAGQVWETQKHGTLLTIVCDDGEIWFCKIRSGTTYPQRAFKDGDLTYIGESRNVLAKVIRVEGK